MLKNVALALVFGALLAAWAAPARADTITISDNYVGGIGATKTTSGYTAVSSSSAYYQVDRIGDVSKYEVYGMSVTYSGNSLTVNVESSYFDNVGSDSTSMGDLFISSDGYNMGSQTSPYKTDTGVTGEDWEYVLVMDNHTGTSSGTVYLYAISGGSQAATNGTVNETTAPTNSIYRAGQEATFVPNTGEGYLAVGTWSITNNSGDHDFLTFSIDISGSGYNLFDSGSSALGFHWAMTCGNDTIEGVAPVPEPATAVLVAGALAFGALRRRRRR